MEKILEALFRPVLELDRPVLERRTSFPAAPRALPGRAGRLLRILITIGFLALAYSSLLFGRINVSITMSSIVWSTILSGVAISLIFAPLATASMGMLQQDQIGNASAGSST